MSKITPLMTSLHEGHKTEERIKCIDNMLFKKCEDTKDTVLQAFWWYRKHSIPLDKVELAKEKIQELLYQEVIEDNATGEPTELTEIGKGLNMALDIIYKLIESEGNHD